MSDDDVTEADARLIDNAACCSQHRALIDDESVRECIALNVCKPLRAQRDAAIARVRKLEWELACAAAELETHEAKCANCGTRARQARAAIAGKGE